MWLLVGGDSEIGAAALPLLRNGGHEVAATSRRLAAADRIHLDLNDPLDDWGPPPGTEAVSIFAAVARLAACAADPVGSARVNVTQTLALAERLMERGVYVLFLSTNQVFDGRTARVPADAPTAPVGEYGRQKARTEAVLRAHMARGAPAAILRLAKVVSPQTALVREWRAALAADKPIRAFFDMTMAPAPIAMVVRAIEALMASRAPGIFQLTGPRDVPYSDVGAFVAKRLGADASLVHKVSVASAALPAGVAPAHTTLDSSALRERFGIAVPDAWEVLEDAISAGKA